jgi:hypothetical protein
VPLRRSGKRSFRTKLIHRSDVLLPLLCAACVFLTAEVLVLALIAVMLGWSFRRAWASYRGPRKRERISCTALTELDRETVTDLICRQGAA